MSIETLALMTGIDIPIEECRIVLHQPTIKEISYVGEKKFFHVVQTMCVQKEMLISKDYNLPLDQISNFQVFMQLLEEKEKGTKLKEDLKQVIIILFPEYTFSLTPRSLFFKKGDAIFTIDEDNFIFLQQALENVFCLSNEKEITYNPANKKAQEIADKIMKGRQRIAAAREQSDSSVLSEQLSILAVALHWTLEQCYNLTMYQLKEVMTRLNLFINWDLDVKSHLAGGKSDKKVDFWMKNLH